MALSETAQNPFKFFAGSLRDGNPITVFWAAMRFYAKGLSNCLPVPDLALRDARCLYLVGTGTPLNQTDIASPCELSLVLLSSLDLKHCVGCGLIVR